MGSPGPRAIQNRVKLSFLTAAFDPQTDVQRSQNYGGFVAIFRSDIKSQCAYSSVFKRFS